MARAVLEVQNKTISYYWIPVYLVTYSLIHSLFTTPVSFASRSIFSKVQAFLLRTVQTLLPMQEIHLNFRHPDIRSSKSGRPLELDVFVPNMSLAFEYQGEMHYRSFTMYHYMCYSLHIYDMVPI